MAQVSGENQMNNAEGNYLQPKILCYYKDLLVHVTFTAQLMHSFRIKKMLNNLLRICPVKSKIWE